LNYEALRHVEVDAMVDTVPTAAEDSGDFSQSGVNIYDPSTTTPNPGYNSSLPVSKANPQNIRQQFVYNGVKNVIPPGRLAQSQAATIMLNKYTPLPNTMNMGSSTMMGQPTVIGAGNDANNYLDTHDRRPRNGARGSQLRQRRHCLHPLLSRERIWLHAGGPARLWVVSR
jgi:hypothetical protein